MSVKLYKNYFKLGGGVGVVGWLFFGGFFCTKLGCGLGEVHP